ncbi:unnamed protein product [Heligmosomoides polygyrus]|uniref:Cilia- and flagella-associated protein 299 n=1 Tax=Heligmosomoides polygyrus TaxID=6339 RepID=A0A183F479_HELPZ|nr:unnamed protein product [Heligmosomoides polygyrus]
MEIHFTMFGVTEEHLEHHLYATLLWVLDGTVAIICLFLIAEDAFLLYELNCEEKSLNSIAYLSLREAVEADNRYLKDAVILEALESQDEVQAQGGTAATAAAKSDQYQEEEVSADLE